jgi:hypothetical protein
MAFFDFIQNRNASKQQSVANRPKTQTPETAKEMYSCQGAQQTANQKSLEQMPPDQRAKVNAIKERLEKATQHINKDAYARTAAPIDSMGNREAMRQNMTGQDNAAPALSPTDHRAAQTVQGNAPAQSNDWPAKAPEKSTARAQTLPRPRPSWER